MWSRRSLARIDRVAALRFFFYGTLIAGSDNDVARAIHARLRPLGRASVAGALWAIPDPVGWYPALVAGETRAHGELYEATHDFCAQDEARIDAWEDYVPGCPQDSLYARASEMVTLGQGGALRAQVYRFIQPLPGQARPILAGDFEAWLRGQDYSAFSG